MFVRYDPKIHTGDVKLYELQSVRTGGAIESRIVRSSVSSKAASAAPFFYFVEQEQEQDEVEEGVVQRKGV